MNFDKFILTDLGIAARQEVIGEHKAIIFTSMAVGSGHPIDESDVFAMTALLNPIMDIEISHIQSTDTDIQVTGKLDNSTVTEQLSVAEIGLFAQIDGEAEILYAYAFADSPLTVPDSSNPFIIEWKTSTSISRAYEAIVTFDTSLGYVTQADGDNLQQQINQNSQQISALSGRGGYIKHTNFGSDNPTQEQITEYACGQIWDEGGIFSWDSANPSQSTYQIGDTTHTVSEIFNSTRVRNDFNGNTWELANTQDTVPTVFIWEDIGIDSVAIATTTAAGIVKAGGDVSVDSEGVITLTQRIAGVAWNDIPSGSYSFATWITATQKGFYRYNDVGFADAPASNGIVFIGTATSGSPITLSNRVIYFFSGENDANIYVCTGYLDNLTLNGDHSVLFWKRIATESDINTLQQQINGFVPQTRTINSKALSSDIILTPEDIGAAPTSHASSSTTYGEASDAIYGHVRFPTGTTSTSQTSVLPYRYIYGTSATINLNDYRTAGIWTFYYPGSTSTNFPSDWGTLSGSSYVPILEVIPFYSNTAVKQILHKRGTNNTWMRYSTSATAWSDWASVATGVISTYSGTSCYTAVGTTGGGYAIQVPNIDATVWGKVVSLNFTCYAQNIGSAVPTNLFTLQSTLRPSATRYICLTATAGNSDGMAIDPCQMAAVYASISTSGIINPSVGWSSFWAGWTATRSYRFHFSGSYIL